MYAILLFVGLTTIWIGVAMAKKGNWSLLLMMTFIVFVIFPFVDWLKKRSKRDDKTLYPTTDKQAVKRTVERWEENGIQETERLYREHLKNEEWRNR